MNFKNVIITGANRGIGLEFVKQLLKQNNPPNNLIATTRKASTELENLKSLNSTLHILNCDITNYNGYDSFVQQIQEIVQDEGIDLLVNNAGINIRTSLETVTAKDILTNVEINAVAPLMLTKALLPFLKASSANRKTVVANITSKMGSIADNTSGSFYAYRTSKAAMNMISKSLAVDLQLDKIIVLSLHPGWVQTEMGGPNALINTETSVTGMLDVIHKSELNSSGAFLDYAGKIIFF